jgi:hypothetical protein
MTITSGAKYNRMSVGLGTTKTFGYAHLSLALRYARLWRDTKAAPRCR